MLKNKDGSYNTFPLLIIGLIIIISIGIIGILVAENIDFPEPYTAPLTVTPVETYIQENISSYNSTFGEINYSEYKNWTWINSTNTTYTYIAGGGGSIQYINLSLNTSSTSPKIIPTPLLLQNISSIITYLNPFESSILILILVFPIALIIFNSRQALTGILMIFLFACFFGFVSISNLALTVPLIIGVYILMTHLFDR